MAARPRRTLVGATALVVVAGVLAAGPATGQVDRERGDSRGSAVGVDRSGSSEPPLLRRTGDLRERPAGMPSSSVPAQRLVSASVTQDLERGRISAQVRLEAVADRGTESNMWLGFGRADGASCNAELLAYVNTRPGSGHLADYGADGSIRFEKIHPEASDAAWDCAVLLLAPPGDPQAHRDVLVGRLADVRAAAEPRLEVRAPRTVSLRQRSWATVTVRVANEGTGPARSTRLRLSGRGIAVRDRTVSLGTIQPGRSVRTKVRVRVAGRDERRLSARATAGAGSAAVAASAMVRLLPTFRARPPVPGTYRGANGLRFRITPKRTITGWKAPVPQQCGYGVEAWWMTSQLSFPTTRIRRNGTVARTLKRDDHTKRLSALVDGRRVTRGTFVYRGPGQCSGSLDWTAKRTGR